MFRLEFSLLSLCCRHPSSVFPELKTKVDVLGDMVMGEVKSKSDFTLSDKAIESIIYNVYGVAFVAVVVLFVLFLAQL